MTVARLNAASLRFKNWLRWSLVCLCVTLAACGGRVDLMGSIPEDEANDVLAALLKENIAAEKVSGKEGMVGVRVDSQQVGRSLEILRANGVATERATFPCTHYRVYDDHLVEARAMALDWFQRHL